jgi:hypothetical protein
VLLNSLLLSLFLQFLKTQCSAYELLPGTDSLVPATFTAVGIILRYARSRNGMSSDVGASVGDLILGFGDILPFCWVMFVSQEALR